MLGRVVTLLHDAGPSTGQSELDQLFVGALVVAGRSPVLGQQ